jgi:cyclopropane fatty-acyl-phospholipid synthase-like methyltransferase
MRTIMAEQIDAEEFKRWETRFSAPGYHFGTEPNAFLKRQAHLLRPGQTALAVADGQGRNGVWLAEQGLDVLSVDFSPTGLAKAQELAAARGVKLRTECADMTQWSWRPETFDVIVGILIQFAPPEEQARMFAGMVRALKPGGLLLLEGYGRKQIEYGTGGPRDVNRLYTRERLEAAFKDLASLDIQEYDTEMSEGTAHVGMSALVDLVGRK